MVAGDVAGEGAGETEDDGDLGVGVALELRAQTGGGDVDVVERVGDEVEADGAVGGWLGGDGGAGPRHLPGDAGRKPVVAEAQSEQGGAGERGEEGEEASARGSGWGEIGHGFADAG